jgi:hypothetical protein
LNPSSDSKPHLCVKPPSTQSIEDDKTAQQATDHLTRTPIRLANSLNEPLDTPHQTRLSTPHSRQSHSQHRDETQRDMNRYLSQPSYPQPVKQKPLLRATEQPLNAPPAPEQIHKPPSTRGDEVSANPQGTPQPRVPPYGYHRLGTVSFSHGSHVLGAVLGISQYRFEPESPNHEASREVAGSRPYRSHCMGQPHMRWAAQTRCSKLCALGSLV